MRSSEVLFTIYRWWSHNIVALMNVHLDLWSYLYKFSRTTWLHQDAPIIPLHPKDMWAGKLIAPNV